MKVTQPIQLNLSKLQIYEENFKILKGHETLIVGAGMKQAVYDKYNIPKNIKMLDKNVECRPTYPCDWEDSSLLTTFKLEDCFEIIMLE